MAAGNVGVVTLCDKATATLSTALIPRSRAAQGGCHANVSYRGHRRRRGWFGRNPAEAGETEPKLGRVMCSAFQCSILAEMAEDKTEQGRLFTAGQTAGKTFLDRIENGTITEQERKETPIGVSMYLAGPNIDFIIGPIFENAAGDAYDSVVKQDANGLPWTHPNGSRTRS